MFWYILVHFGTVHEVVGPCTLSVIQKKFPQLHLSVLIATQAVGSITTQVLLSNNI